MRRSIEERIFTTTAKFVKTSKNCEVFKLEDKRTNTFLNIYIPKDAEADTLVVRLERR